MTLLLAERGCDDIMSPFSDAGNPFASFSRRRRPAACVVFDGEYPVVTWMTDFAHTLLSITLTRQRAASNTGGSTASVLSEGSHNSSLLSPRSGRTIPQSIFRPGNGELWQQNFQVPVEKLPEIKRKVFPGA